MVLMQGAFLKLKEINSYERNYVTRNDGTTHSVAFILFCCIWGLLFIAFDLLWSSFSNGNKKIASNNIINSRNYICYILSFSAFVIPNDKLATAIAFLKYYTNVIHNKIKQKEIGTCI